MNSLKTYSDLNFDPNMNQIKLRKLKTKIQALKRKIVNISNTILVIKKNVSYSYEILRDVHIKQLYHF